MPLDFPANPTDGQIYDNYYWDASMQTWRSQTANLAQATYSGLTLNNTTLTGTTTATDLTVGNVSNTEIGYLDGVTSGIQGQINGKANSSHTHAATDITSGTIGLSRLPNSNYATGQGGQLTVSSTTPTTIASCSITTNGRPILVIGTGNMNPIDASVWHRIYLYRDATPIGNYTVVESRGASWNTAFALNHIDVPAAGTYTYSIRAALGSGQGQYGEESSAGAQISVIEIH